jgi:hypothetical protein
LDIKPDTVHNGVIDMKIYILSFLLIFCFLPQTWAKPAKENDIKKANDAKVIEQYLEQYATPYGNKHFSAEGMLDMMMRHYIDPNMSLDLSEHYNDEDPLESVPLR